MSERSTPTDWSFSAFSQPEQEFSDTRPHNNPIDVSDISDADRARMLQKDLGAFVKEFGEIPKLMPLGEEGKHPIIEGRCGLDTQRAKSFLVDGPEAVKRIQDDGERGFGIYPGRPDHNTEDVVFADHDSDKYPVPTGDPTLEVLSGSGRGSHEIYRNDGTVRNAKVGDEWGSIHAENTFVITPGSVHPTGGVYHITEYRPIATLSDGDLEPYMRPADASVSSGTNRRGSTASEESSSHKTSETLETVEYEPASNPPTSEEVADENQKIRTYIERGAKAAGFVNEGGDDRSRADWFVCCTMAEYGVPEREVRQFLNTRPHTKVNEKGDKYWKDTWSGAVSRVKVNSKSLDSNSHSDRLLTRGSTTAADDIRRTAQNKCTRTVRDAVEDGDRVVVDALPTLGKSRSAAKVAAETDAPVTYLTHRIENRNQAARWANEEGLDVHQISAFDRGDHSCPTASGDNGDEWEQKVTDLRDRSVPIREIHQALSDIPCQSNDECPYVAHLDFDPDQFDVLIGHPTHAFIQEVVDGRAVIFDEDPQQAFRTYLGMQQVRQAVRAFLSQRDDIPDTCFDDVRKLRGDDSTRQETIKALENTNNLRDYSVAVESEGGRSDAPAIVYALLIGEEIHDEMEATELPTGDVAVYDSKEGCFLLRTPPDLSDSHAVIGLDGTPTMDVWEGRLGIDEMERRRVLDDDDRKAYLRSGLGNRYIRTTKYNKSYSGGNVNEKKDTALLRAIDDRHDEPVGLITSKKAENKLVDGGDGPAAEYIDIHRTGHYGNLKSSNHLKDTQVGVVNGARYIGDRTVQRLAALDGHVIELIREDSEPVTSGRIGKKYLRHVRENHVVQAALRFGRDGNGATVYINTSAIPAWFPAEYHGEAIRSRSEGEQKVIDALTGLGLTSSTDIAEAADLSRQQALNHLKTLEKAGVIDNDGKSRSSKWIPSDQLESGPIEVQLPDLKQQ